MFSLWSAAQGVAKRSGAGLSSGQPVLGGRYRLNAKIGSGTFGCVYRATDMYLGRDVAIKTVAPAANAEALALAKVRHTNVVTLHDHGVDAATGYLVMELLTGQTLSTWRHAKPRTREEIVGVYLRAGQGLAAVHAKGVVHRDFKPDNVVICADGRVVVVDFGLATRGSVRDVEHIGTPEYAAPEQLAGNSGTAATDQFSFCVALWEALAGQSPFGGKTLVGKIEAHLDGPRAGGPPGPLGAVLRRGLEVSPLQRWPSMAALIAEIRHAERRVRQRRPMLAAAGLVVAAAVALGIVGVDPVDSAASSLLTDRDLTVESLAMLAEAAARDGRGVEACAILHAASMRSDHAREIKATAKAADMVGMALYESGDYGRAIEAHAQARGLYLRAGSDDLAIRSNQMARVAEDALERAG